MKRMMTWNVSSIQSEGFSIIRNKIVSNILILAGMEYGHKEYWRKSAFIYILKVKLHYDNELTDSLNMSRFLLNLIIFLITKQSWILINPNTVVY